MNERVNFTAKSQDGTQEVTGYAVGEHLAVHPTLFAGDRESPPWHWTVSHRETGRAIAQGFTSKELARSFAEVVSVFAWEEAVEKPPYPAWWSEVPEVVRLWDVFAEDLLNSERLTGRWIDSPQAVG